MSDDRLFPIEEVPEVPVLRAPSKAFTRGAHDERFRNDYPPEWDRCTDCGGEGRVWGETLPVESRPLIDADEEVQLVWSSGPGHLTAQARGEDGIRIVLPRAHVGVFQGIRRRDRVCGWCAGMGSIKAKVRYLAGHRCERCKHPYVPKVDAEMLLRLGEPKAPSWEEGGWSRCDEGCQHDMANARFYPRTSSPIWNGGSRLTPQQRMEIAGPVTRLAVVEAAWRILTVHHLNGDKADLRWWNLAALCQRCHLYIQNRVVMERVYPLQHSEWFKPHAAGWYAWIYLGEELTRDEVDERMDELLALELAPA